MKNLPLCVQAMKCWCAGHAWGIPYSDPCDTDEKYFSMEPKEPDPDVCECDECLNYDPTPYETGEPRNLPREAAEQAMDEWRMKR